jgi:hypothetical protein
MDMQSDTTQSHLERNISQARSKSGKWHSFSTVKKPVIHTLNCPRNTCTPVARKELECQPQTRRNAAWRRNGSSREETGEINDVHAVVQVRGLNLERSSALLLTVKFGTGNSIQRKIRTDAAAL